MGIVCEEFSGLCVVNYGGRVDVCIFFITDLCEGILVVIIKNLKLGNDVNLIEVCFLFFERSE